MGDDRTPADVMRLLADDTRIAVLRAVAMAQCRSGGANAESDEANSGSDGAEADRDDVNPGPVELSFSEIYDRVDVENTSKLSYHLGELAGTFLHKGEGGYSFTHAGERITRFVLAANYEAVPEFGPEPVDGTCPFCGGTALEAKLHHQFFFVECQDCGRPVSGFTVTPAQARARDGGALVDAVRRKQARDYAQVRRGVCPQCAGPVETDVRHVPESPLPDADPFVAVDECTECRRQYNAPLTYGVAYHPASVAFHWDRGVDVTEKGLWAFHAPVVEGRWTAERVATGPDEYDVVFRHDEDVLRCRLDADATVTRTERVRRR